MAKSARRPQQRVNILLSVFTIAATFVIAAAAAAGPYVYVLNRGSQDVSVIDLHSRTEMAVVSIRHAGLAADDSADPRELILHPNRPELYVLADGYVAVVNTTTLDAADNRYISLSVAQPRGFALDASGTTLFVSYKNTNTLTSINVFTHSQASRALMLSDLRHLAASGNFLWGVNKGGDAFRLDLSPGGAELVLGTRVFKDPEGMAISADRQTVLVSTEFQMGVVAFDVSLTSLGPNSGSRIFRGIDPGRVRSFPNGDAAVVNADDDQVLLSNGTLVLPVGSHPTDVAENELGTRVVSVHANLTWSGNPTDGSVRVFDASGSGTTDIEVGRAPVAIAMGRGNVGELRIAPDPVKFDYLKAGQVVLGSVSVESIGDRDVAISRISVTTGAPFRWVGDNCPSRLYPGDTCTVEVAFTAPASAGTIQCNNLRSSSYCFIVLWSYKGWLEVANDAALNPVSGVSLWADRFAVEELQRTPVAAQEPAYELDWIIDSGK
jgi:YVTN family beta-propeller protein